MGDLMTSLLDKLRAKKTSEHERAVQSLEELLAAGRYDQPEPGDEDRLADALDILSIPADELHRYVDFIRELEANTAAAVGVDAKRATWRDSADNQREFEEERQRTIADLAEKSRQLEAVRNARHHEFAHANTAAGKAAAARRQWERFAGGGDLFVSEPRPRQVESL